MEKDLDPLPFVDSPLVVEDRRAIEGTRHKSPRFRMLKGAQIASPTAGVSIKCIVRNLSQTGAKIEVYEPVPESFELIFDCNEARRNCRVMWRTKIHIGVKFI
jgi:PilZ domain